MNRGQDIVVHFVPPQKPGRLHYSIECRFAGFVYPEGVMKISGPVQAQADEEVVLMEEFAPFIVKKSTIGLHGVLDDHFWAPILLLILD